MHPEKEAGLAELSPQQLFQEDPVPEFAGALVPPKSVMGWEQRALYQGATVPLGKIRDWGFAGLCD